MLALGHRRTAALAVLAGLLHLVGGCGDAPDGFLSPGGLRILFIGNSLTYTNDLPGVVQAMIESATSTAVTISSVTPGGVGLEDHWVSGVALDRIRQDGWDIVVLQQGPSATEGRPSLLEYSQKFAQEIRGVGAVPALYMVWPEEARSFDFAGVSESYRMAAELVDGLLFPVGEAWLETWRQDPSIDLYGPDGFHPSAAGTYLAALVMFQQLTGKTPVGMPAQISLRNNQTIEVPGSWAPVLQQAAVEANNEFARRPSPDGERRAAFRLATSLCAEHGTNRLGVGMMQSVEKSACAPAPPRDASLLVVPLDRDGEVPLFRQVYRSIRQAIMEGRLPSGARMPSTRALAAELGVSRNTVLQAFDLLVAEGFLMGKAGGGTRVSSVLADRGSPRRPTPRARTSAETRASRGAAGAMAVPSGLPQGRSPDGAFASATIAPELFPAQLWRKLTNRCLRDFEPAHFSTPDARGIAPLRGAVADYLAARGVPCNPDDIVIVSGVQQGIDLSVRTLLEPHDVAALEEPGFPGAHGAVAASGATVAPIPVDQAGIRVDQIEAMAAPPRLVYVSPSHQFPLGGRLALERRLALLAWAARHDAWIIEDDYDSEFRYRGEPLTALRGLDEHDRVVYLGSFNKTLFSGLRIGYAVVPEPLRGAFLGLRVHSDLHPPLIAQLVMTAFLAEGHFARHVRGMRKVFRGRHDLLLALGRAELAGLLDLQPDETGLRMVGFLPEGVSDRAGTRAAEEHGVEVLPLSQFYIGDCPRPGLVLGFGATDERGIRDGVRRLAAALRALG